jgi:hypothetical protein
MISFRCGEIVNVQIWVVLHVFNDWIYVCLLNEFMISGTVGPGFQSKKKQHKKNITLLNSCSQKKKTHHIKSYLNSKYWYSLYIYRKQKNISIYRLSMYIYSLVPQTWICHDSYCRKNKLHLRISSVLVASAVVIKFAVQAQAGDEIHI